MAEFDSATELWSTRLIVRTQAGYEKIDAYSPFPIEGLAEAIGFHKNRVPLVVLIGGIDRRSVRLSDAVLDFGDQVIR